MTKQPILNHWITIFFKLIKLISFVTYAHTQEKLKKSSIAKKKHATKCRPMSELRGTDFEDQEYQGTV